MSIYVTFEVFGKTCRYVWTHVYLSFRDPADDLFPAGHQRSHHHGVRHHTEERQIRKTHLHTRIMITV